MESNVYASIIGKEYQPLHNVEDGEDVGIARYSPHQRWSFLLFLGYALLALWTAGLGWSHLASSIVQEDIYCIKRFPHFSSSREVKT